MSFDIDLLSREMQLIAFKARFPAPFVQFIERARAAASGDADA